MGMTKKKDAEFQKIKDKIKDVFDALTQQFLPKDRNSLTIGFDLPSLYRQATKANGGVPSPDTEKDLVEVAKAYLDGAQARTEANLRHVASANAKSEIDVENAVSDVLNNAQAEVERIVSTESQRARATGAWDGVIQTSAKLGIDDPTVFWVCVRDDKLCEVCRRLHLMNDNTTPRVWKMSEATHDYYKKGVERPSIQGLHPHDRCSLTVCLPGFGFDAAGNLTYKYQGYDEYERQRGTSEQ